MNDDLSIGGVARKLGLNPKTIRYYEDIGLIPAPKRKGGNWPSAGWRIFTQKDIERLTFIKQARLLDLSLSQIKELLAAMESSCGCGCAAGPLLKTFLEAKFKEIDEKIEALETLRGRLQALYRRNTEMPVRRGKPLSVPVRPAMVEAVFGETSSGMSPNLKLQ